MPFTEEEQRRWHAERQQRQRVFGHAEGSGNATCMICFTTSRHSEGRLTPDFALCGSCDDHG